MITLRDYQKKAKDRMVRQKANLEFDEMGLGKTLTTLAAIKELDAFPALVVCPKFALGVWEEEASLVNIKTYTYSGKPKERLAVWRKFKADRDSILITNYAFQVELATLSNIKVPNTLKNSVRTALVQRNPPPGSRARFCWKSIIWDEAHMGLMNPKNKTYKAALALAKNIPVRYVLTGTPFRQGCKDLYGPLSLVDYQRFNSFWTFLKKYCVVFRNPWGMEVARNPSNLKVFRQLLSGYVIRRLKTDVLTELPELQRQVISVEMTPKQLKVYKELEEENMSLIADSGDILVTPNQMSLLLRLRQLMCCPRILGIDDNGAELNALVEHATSLIENGKPVVIFTPFRKALPFIKGAFNKEFKDITYYEIKGQLTAGEFRKAWMGFQNDKHKHKILLCVIKSGASFQATAASSAYFLGYEWDFNLNLQAEARLHRMGQTESVNIYYMAVRDTVDYYVLRRLQEKVISSKLVVGSNAQLKSVLKDYYKVGL